MNNNLLSIVGYKCLSILIFLLFFIGSAHAEENAQVNNQGLRSLLALGLAENLGLQTVEVDTLQAGQEVTVQDARFDPELFAEAFHAESRTPVTGSFSPDLIRNEQTRAEFGIRKNFATGLNTSLSLTSERVEGDYEYLDPRYSSYLLLSLKQPLLRSFGTDVNTTDLQVSKNQQLQSQYYYLRQAETLALQIELVYYDLIRARQTELLRLEARQLVVDLLAGNRSKLEAGVIPVSEVQEAETALADRDLQLALAKQTREQVAHLLNSLINNSLTSPAELSAEFNDVPLQSPVPSPDFSTVYAIAIDNRVDLKALALDMENSTLRRSYLANQTRPELDMVVSAGLNGLAGSNSDGTVPARNNGGYFDSYEGLGNGDGYQWSAGLTFSYPLGNREAKARVGQARLTERQTGYRKQELELAIETELLQRLTEMTRTAEQFEIADRLQSLADTTLNQENRRLAEGLSDTFRVLTFQGALINSRIGRLSALIDYNKSQARFYQAQGINLERHGIIARIDQKEIRFENM